MSYERGGPVRCTNCGKPVGHTMVKKGYRNVLFCSVDCMRKLGQALLDMAGRLAGKMPREKAKAS